MAVEMVPTMIEERDTDVRRTVAAREREPRMRPRPRFNRISGVIECKLGSANLGQGRPGQRRP